MQELGQLLMPDLRRLKEQLKPSGVDTADAISATVIAIQMISAHCRQLQYIRRIVLVTDGYSPVDDSDVKAISEKLLQDKIELVVLGLDFDDDDYDFKEQGKSSQKAKVEGQLKALTDACNGVYGTLAQAIDEMTVPRIKSVRPVNSYKGLLTLGDPSNYDSGMAIDVERYPKTMVAKPPTASSFVIKSNMAPEETQTAEDTDTDGLASIKRARTYQVPDSEAAGGKKDVEEEDLAKGYAYGSTAVYIAESDQNVTKFETVPGLDIIGFVAKEHYSRYMDMSRANVIIAQRTNDKACMALSSFIHALYELDSYAVARFVAKPDKAPAILLLTPNIEPDFECLYDVELPFAEDVRQYRFPPLDRILTVSGKNITSHRNLPTKELQDAMSKYVDSMDLSKGDEEDEETEYAAIDDTFSPLLHRINQVIRHRAIHHDSPIPGIPTILTKFSHPPSHLVSKSKSHLDKLISAGNVKKVPPRLRARRGRGSSSDKSSADANRPLSGLDINALLSTPSTKSSRAKIDPNNAVPEFKQMVDLAGDIKAIHSACEQMGEVLQKMTKNSVGEAKYAQVIEGLKVMRNECVELEEARWWNEFVKKFKDELLSENYGGKRSELWWLIKINKLGLITSEECKEGGVNDEEVKAFWTTKS